MIYPLMEVTIGELAFSLLNVTRTLLNYKSTTLVGWFDYYVSPLF